MIIPYESLNQDVLRNIIRENIVRITSDFEGDFDNEIDKVIGKIKNNEISIVYSQAKDDVTLVATENLKKK